MSYLGIEGEPPRDPIRETLVRDGDPGPAKLKFSLDDQKSSEVSNFGVFVRVRPLIDNEVGDFLTPSGPQQLIVAKPPDVLLFHQPHATQGKIVTNAMEHKMEFTRVFTDDASQEEIYENVCACAIREQPESGISVLFSYGTSSAGKTYTMRGTRKNPGVISRAVEDVFRFHGRDLRPDLPVNPSYFTKIAVLDDNAIKSRQQAKQRLFAMQNFDPSSSGLMDSIVSVSSTQSSLKSDYPYATAFVSFLEIYQGSCFDILNPITLGARREVLKVRDYKSGSDDLSYVAGLSEIPVQNASEALTLWRAGMKNLQYASTALNTNSSRSHCIFTLKVVRIDDLDQPTTGSTTVFSFCDLAGAERAEKAETKGHSFRETRKINASISSLMNCIRAMRKADGKTKQNVVIPFRTCRLSHVLKNFFLQGQVRMLVNVSPSMEVHSETLTVLRFCTEAEVVLKSYSSKQEHSIEEKPSSTAFQNFVAHARRMTMKVSTSSLAEIESSSVAIINEEKSVDEEMHTVQTSEIKHEDEAAEHTGVKDSTPAFRRYSEDDELLNQWIKRCEAFEEQSKVYRGKYLEYKELLFNERDAHSKRIKTLTADHAADLRKMYEKGLDAARSTKATVDALFADEDDDEELSPPRKNSEEENADVLVLREAKTELEKQLASSVERANNLEVELKEHVQLVQVLEDKVKGAVEFFSQKREETAELEGVIEKLRNENAGLEANLEDAKLELDAKRAESMENIRNFEQEVNELKEEFEGKLLKLQQTNADQCQQLKELQNKSEQMKEEFSVLQKNHDCLVEELKDKKQSSEKLENTLQDRNAVIDEKEKKCGDLLEKISSLESAQILHKETYGKICQENLILKEKLEDALKTNAKLEKEKSGIEAQMAEEEKIRASCEGIHESLKAMKNKLNSIQKENEALKSGRTIDISRMEELSHQLMVKERELVEAEGEIAVLQKECKKLSAKDGLLQEQMKLAPKSGVELNSGDHTRAAPAVERNPKTVFVKPVEKVERNCASSPTHVEFVPPQTPQALAAAVGTDAILTPPLKRRMRPKRTPSSVQTASVTRSTASKLTKKAKNILLEDSEEEESSAPKRGKRDHENDFASAKLEVFNAAYTYAGLDIVHPSLVEHGYCKPWYSAPNLVLKLPRREIFFSDPLESHSLASANVESEEVDVGIEEPCVTKAPPRWTPSIHPKQGFQESMQDSWENAAFISLVHPDDVNEENWEANLNKLAWSKDQLELFQKAMKIITDALLGFRCCPSTDNNTSVRLHLDLAARRLRGVFASIEWKSELTDWLHQLMMENAGYSDLAVYLDVIQTLRSMLPAQVDHMFRVGIMKRSIPPDALNFLFRKPWEPRLPKIHSISKMRNVNLVVLEAFPQQGSSGHSSQQKRRAFWNDSFQQLGNVVLANPTIGGGSLWTAKHYVESIEVALMSKITETRQHLNLMYHQSQKNRPGSEKEIPLDSSKEAALALNPIVLIGWDTGAVSCAQLAKKIKNQGIAAIICLGFPTSTLVGKRGKADDSLVDLDCDILFIVGENAVNTRLQDLEALRSQMKGGNSLLVVGGADEHLMLSPETLMREKITQNVADAMLINEISHYLEATIGRQQQQYLGCISGPDEAPKGSDGLSAWSTHGMASGSAIRPSSFDQTAGFVPSRVIGPVLEPVVSSKLELPPMTSGITISSSSVPIDMPADGSWVEQARLQSAIASILGDTEDILDTFDDQVLDINVGEATGGAIASENCDNAADAALANIFPSVGLSDSPLTSGALRLQPLLSPLPKVNTPIGQLVTAAQALENKLRLGNPVGNAVKRPASESVAPMVTKFPRLDTTTTPLRSSSSVGPVIPAVSQLNVLKRTSGAGVLFGSPESALSQFAVTATESSLPAKVSISPKKPSPPQTGKTLKVNFSMTPGGLLSRQEPEPVQESEYNFVGSSILANQVAGVPTSQPLKPVKRTAISSWKNVQITSVRPRSVVVQSAAVRNPNAVKSIGLKTVPLARFPNLGPNVRVISLANINTRVGLARTRMPVVLRNADGVATDGAGGVVRMARLTTTQKGVLQVQQIPPDKMSKEDQLNEKVNCESQDPSPLLLKHLSMESTSSVVEMSTTFIQHTPEKDEEIAKSSTVTAELSLVQVDCVEASLNPKPASSVRSPTPGNCSDEFILEALTEADEIQCLDVKKLNSEASPVANVGKRKGRSTEAVDSSIVARQEVVRHLPGIRKTACLLV
ncbi:unnamed protein product [Notodromas monacha]|uniref:Kinesin motor domain-containing protein n=1 Tax=Notodromas monacha TaxID=399045 RepID=A0A7R9BTH3_9CRUS|nr:unnamed protein product [Notodromas monacha]CAG0920415.1 unnamed protein product [Notodromas monacha]